MYTVMKAEQADKGVSAKAEGKVEENVVEELNSKIKMLKGELSLTKKSIIPYEENGRGRICKEMPIVINPFDLQILNSREQNPLVQIVKQRLLNYCQEEASK